MPAAVLRHHSSSQLKNATLRLNRSGDAGENGVCDTRTWLNITKVTVTAASCTRPSSATKDARVFNGLINVAQHAIKPTHRMTNNNLLLGKLAEVDTKTAIDLCR
ncbi:SufD family Fe-S cluster assembly protein [Salmonella enterica subsp. enterica]|nr:SufD family Fe-S cluster assembly protein [Salmonella enterica subsp. enterica]